MHTATVPAIAARREQPWRQITIKSALWVRKVSPAEKPQTPKNSLLIFTPIFNVFIVSILHSGSAFIIIVVSLKNTD